MQMHAAWLASQAGRSVHTEASPRTQTFDLVAAIRVRKWKWLGHILRAKGDRLIKLALKVQFDKGDRLNMLQDIPKWCDTFDQLLQLAQNRDVWRAYQPSRRKASTRSSSTTNTDTSSSKPSAYSLRSRHPYTRCVTVSKDDPEYEAVHNLSFSEADAPSHSEPEPATRPATKPMQLKAAKTKKKKKGGAKPWSNKRRQAFALAHWQTNHGHTTNSTTNSTTTASPTTPQTTTTTTPGIFRNGRWRHRHKRSSEPPASPLSASPQTPASPATTTPTTTTPNNHPTTTTTTSPRRTPVNRNSKPLPIWARYGRWRARCQATHTTTPKTMPATPNTKALRAVFDSDSSSYDSSASSYYSHTQADFVPKQHDSNLFKANRHQPHPSHANSELWTAAAPLDSYMELSFTPSPSPFPPPTEPAPMPSPILPPLPLSSSTVMSGSWFTGGALPKSEDVKKRIQKHQKLSIPPHMRIRVRGIYITNIS